ncbi:MAG: hypothetical protein FJ014_10695 [Chloroflexi bacterium]|nr:hypothetical protein [Chloroflexota bacterium]
MATTSEDIQFFINNERVGRTTIVGPQPNMDFFHQLKEHLKGECIVTFQIGDRKVDNKVILNKTLFKVESNFVPFDIDSYVSEEKKRVRKEQETAHFFDQSIDVYFIPAKTLLDSVSTFPSFNRAKLVEDPQGQRFFVSHRWYSYEHPDPEGKQLAMIKDHARNHPDAFYWIDFSCLPQPPRNVADEEYFRRMLPKIATIQSDCSTIVIMDGEYSNRMWCYMEHFMGIIFSQSEAKYPRGIEYFGSGARATMVDKVQTLEEPPWNLLKVTNSSDIPGIKYNYRFMTNLVRFQLFDRFAELIQSMPGHEIYPGLLYPQSAFGIQYTKTLEKLRALFIEFGGDPQYFYSENSLLWLAERISWSIFPDNYKVEQFNFSKYLFFSEDTAGWIALLLAIIKILNKGNAQIINLRELYARIILLSLFR